MRLWLLLALALFVTEGALAEYPLDATFDMPPPPPAGSPKAQRDYAELHRWQKTRTQNECKIAGTQSRMDLGSFFGPRAGILSQSELSTVEILLLELKNTVNHAAKPFKEAYARPRPYSADHTIEPCVEMPGGATSYPSSHAAIGIVMSRVLADLLPASRAEIEAQGFQIGTNRILGGVHHPSDVEAGQDLGEQIYEALQSNPHFKADFAGAKRALGL